MEDNKVLNESSTLKNHFACKGYSTLGKCTESTDTDATGVMKNNGVNSNVNLIKRMTSTHWWQRPELEIVPARLSFLMDGGWHR